MTKATRLGETRMLPFANRKYRDSVFGLLYKDRKNLLELYNSVNGTEYDNPDDLEITTMDETINLKVKNDLSCMLYKRLDLYEQQSTPNPNIPFRDLLYIAEQYMLWFQRNGINIYGRKAIGIPTPKFVVFYNGASHQPEKSVYRLSDLFEIPDAEINLELVVTQYNINAGCNGQLLSVCRTLREYMLFVEKVRRKEKDMEVRKAVEQAVDECIKEGVLKEFFEKNREKVIEMGTLEFMEQLHQQGLLEEGREEGREEGLKEGIEAFVLDKLEDGFPQKEITARLMRRFGISEAEAKGYLDGAADTGKGDKAGTKKC